MQNKETIETYMDAFRRTAHAEILSCLTDDVEWIIPGAFHHVGKEAFDKEIENDEMRGGKIRRLISYLMETKAPA